MPKNKKHKKNKKQGIKSIYLSEHHFLNLKFSNENEEELGVPFNQIMVGNLESKANGFPYCRILRIF